MEIPRRKLGSVFPNQLTGLRLPLHCPDRPALEGQLHADTAGARPHIPADILGRHRQFRQDSGPDLLLGHRHLSPQKRLIGKPRRPAWRAGGRLGQQDAQGRKGSLRHVLRRAMRNAFPFPGEVLPHCHLQAPQSSFRQLPA